MKYKLAIEDASVVLLQGTKWAIFKNQSTTTIIESLFLWVRGKPKTKSKLTSSHEALGTSNGVYNPMFDCDS